MSGCTSVSEGSESLSGSLAASGLGAGVWSSAAKPSDIGTVFGRLSISCEGFGIFQGEENVVM